MEILMLIELIVLLLWINKLDKEVETQKRMIDAIFVFIYDETGTTIKETRDKLETYIEKEAMDKVIGR